MEDYLKLACKSGNLDRIQNYINKQRGPANYNSLFVEACKLDKPDIINYLLSLEDPKFIDIHFNNSQGLRILCENNSIDALRFVFKHRPISNDTILKLRKIASDSNSKSVIDFLDSKKKTPTVTKNNNVPVTFDPKVVQDIMGEHSTRKDNKRKDKKRTNTQPKPKSKEMENDDITSFERELYGRGENKSSSSSSRRTQNRSSSKRTESKRANTRTSSNKHKSDNDNSDDDAVMNEITAVEKELYSRNRGKRPAPSYFDELEKYTTEPMEEDNEEPIKTCPLKKKRSSKERRSESRH